MSFAACQRGKWRNIASPSDAHCAPRAVASRPWRVIAILWRAAAGPIIPARAKRLSSPRQGLGPFGRRYPNAPCRLWSDTQLDPGMAAAVPVGSSGAVAVP